MRGPQLSTVGLLAVIAAAAIGLGISVYFMERVRRRRCFAALQRVRSRVPCSDDDFVRSLSLDRMSGAAEAALTVRRVFAQSLGIPAETITRTTCLGRDCDMPPLCDSLDIVEILLQLEDQLNIVIPDRVLPNILNVTMEETIRAVLKCIEVPSYLSC